MAKFGLPVYPIYDEMTIQAGQTSDEIEWLIEHGSVYRNGYATFSKPNWRGFTYQEVAMYRGKYAFVAYDDEYRGDDPHPEHYILHWYKTLDELLAKEQISFTGRDSQDIWWKWADSKPDLFIYFDEGGNVIPDPSVSLT